MCDLLQSSTHVRCAEGRQEKKTEVQDSRGILDLCNETVQSDESLSGPSPAGTVGTLRFRFLARVAQPRRRSARGRCRTPESRAGRCMAPRRVRVPHRQTHLLFAVVGHAYGARYGREPLRCITCNGRCATSAWWVNTKRVGSGRAASITSISTGNCAIAASAPAA